MRPLPHLTGRSLSPLPTDSSSRIPRSVSNLCALSLDQGVNLHFQSMQVLAAVTAAGSIYSPVINRLYRLTECTEASCAGGVPFKGDQGPGVPLCQSSSASCREARSCSGCHQEQIPPDALEVGRSCSRLWMPGACESYLIQCECFILELWIVNATSS